MPDSHDFERFLPDGFLRQVIRLPILIKGTNRESTLLGRGVLTHMPAVCPRQARPQPYHCHRKHMPGESKTLLRTLLRFVELNLRRFHGGNTYSSSEISSDCASQDCKSFKSDN